MTRPLNRFDSQQKILRHLDKVDYFMNGHKTLVVTELDLTNRCNNNCPGCIGGREGGAELSREQVDLIVDGLREVENRGVIVSGGGEPLCSPHFVYAMERLARAGMAIGVNSNGLALSGAAAEVIAKNANYLRVSIDAGTPETYRETHGMAPAQYEQTLENVRAFAALKREMGSTINFGIGFLTCEKYAGEMESFVIQARDLGCDFAQFRPYQGDDFDASAEALRLQEQYGTEEFSVLYSAQKYGAMELEDRGYDRCRGMFFSTVITAEARMYACLHYRQRAEYEIGEITAATPLVDVWRSARKWQVYESIDCANCPVRCRNDAFNRTLGDLSTDIPDIEFL